MSLVLDAGALIAVERGDHGSTVVPAGVVGQAWRGSGRQARLARLLNARDVLVEPLTDARPRAAGALCGSAGTADVTDASVVLAARHHHATVVSSDRADLQVLDPQVPVVDC